MEQSNDIKKKRLFMRFLPALIILVLVVIAIKQFIPPSIDVKNISSIDLTISQLFEDDIKVTINSMDDIKKISAIEDTVWKYRGTSFLIKARPWNISFVYHLKNGNTVKREYIGQKGLLELHNSFSFLITENIP